jgi:hypothetical protein
VSRDKNAKQCGVSIWASETSMMVKSHYPFARRTKCIAI